MSQTATSMAQLLQRCNLNQHVPAIGGVSEQIQSSRPTLMCSNIQIVAKASDGQWYQLPLIYCMLDMKNDRGSGPAEANDLCWARIGALRI